MPIGLREYLIVPDGENPSNYRADEYTKGDEAVRTNINFLDYVLSE